MTKLIKHLALWAVLLSASVAFAGSFDFSTNDAGVGVVGNNGQTVDASATIATGSNSVTVTLFDNLNNPTDVAQLVSDIFFTLSGQVGASSLTGSSGTALDVGTNGAFTTGPTISPTNWALDALGSQLHLHFTTGNGSELIIGGSSDGNYTSGTYSNANGSIDNNVHNPFLESGATFTIAVAGVNSDTTVSNVTFSFGTAQIPFSSVPDNGSTLMLLGLGLATCEFGRRALSNRLVVARIGRRS